MFLIIIFTFQMLRKSCCLSGHLLIRATLSRAQMSISSVTSKPIRQHNVSNGFKMCVHCFMSLPLEHEVICILMYELISDVPHFGVVAGGTHCWSYHTTKHQLFTYTQNTPSAAAYVEYIV